MALKIINRHPAAVVRDPEHGAAALVVQAFELHDGLHLEGRNGAKDGAPGFLAHQPHPDLVAAAVHKGRHHEGLVRAVSRKVETSIVLFFRFADFSSSSRSCS